MENVYLENAFQLLIKRGIQIDTGLSAIEVERIEAKYKFRFPADLKTMLQFGLPISDDFPNWREDSEKDLRQRLEWPLEGICFDIEHNQFWFHEWGEKPDSLQEAFDLAKYHVSQAPVLIPIFSHRYIPSEPEIVGNPVYSVYQTDIIYYGYDIPSYLYKEFGVPLPGWQRETPRSIRIWGDLVS